MIRIFPFCPKFHQLYCLVLMKSEGYTCLFIKNFINNVLALWKTKAIPYLFIKKFIIHVIAWFYGKGGYWKRAPIVCPVFLDLFGGAEPHECIPVARGTPVPHREAKLYRRSYHLYKFWRNPETVLVEPHGPGELRLKNTDLAVYPLLDH